MTRFTQEELTAHLARMSKFQKGLKQDEDIPDEGPENILQKKIEDYCDQKGYPCIFFKKSKKAKGFLKPGWPDGTVAFPKSRVVFVELKSETGRLKDKQKEIKLMLLQLGHEWYEVRSYKRWIEIAEKRK